MTEYILFDLDGTLTDPAEGITNSVRYMLTKYGLPVPDRDTLCELIGPPLVESFQKYYGFSLCGAKQAVEVYRDYFRVKGIYENKVYDGIHALLSSLHKDGRKIVLATSKPEHFAKRVLEYFDLDKYFYFAAGAMSDETRTKKGDVIRYALENCGSPDPSRIIMVGDRMHDVIGAKENGLRSIGVLYGYGSREELEGAGADFLADLPLEIEKIIKNIDKEM